MEVLHSHCAGLDVHKDTVVACVRHMVDATVKREVKTFDTTTKGLLALADWLASEGCTHVAMEATGVYWKPVWHVLSDGDWRMPGTSRTFRDVRQHMSVPRPPQSRDDCHLREGRSGFKRRSMIDGLSR
jgi:hypothetical protein